MGVGPSGRRVPAAGTWVMLAIPQLSVAVVSAARFGAGAAHEASRHVLVRRAEVMTGAIGSFTVTWRYTSPCGRTGPEQSRLPSCSISALPKVVWEAVSLTMPLRRLLPQCWRPSWWRTTGVQVHGVSAHGAWPFALYSYAPISRPAPSGLGTRRMSSVMAELPVFRQGALLI